MRLIRAMYDRDPPTDPMLWHPWRVFLPVRDPEGNWTKGRVWRKKCETGRWLYKHRPEDPEDFVGRAI
jgi:hypothetical protein